jgi:hypothetical protein
MSCRIEVYPAAGFMLLMLSQCAIHKHAEVQQWLATHYAFESNEVLYLWWVILWLCFIQEFQTGEVSA